MEAAVLTLRAQIHSQGTRAARGVSAGPSISAWIHRVGERPQNPWPVTCRQQSSHADGGCKQHTRAIPYPVAFPSFAIAAPVSPEANGHFNAIYAQLRPVSYMLIVFFCSTDAKIFVRKGFIGLTHPQQSSVEACLIVCDSAGFHNALFVRQIPRQ